MPSTSSFPHQTSPLRSIKTVSSRRNIILNAPAAQANNVSLQRTALCSPSSRSRGVVPRSDTNEGFARDKAASAGKGRSGSGAQKARFNKPSNIHPAGMGNCPKDSEEEDAPMVQSKQKPNSESSRSAAGSFNTLKDDGTKPSHSYAMLIGMAIVTAPGERMTLAQIYKWITGTFSYYSAAETGWQNSIRHNLSLNKAFVKKGRPKDGPGKGNYWVIAAGQEEKLFKDKQPKKGSIIESGPNTSASVSPPAPPMRDPASLHKNSTAAPVKYPSLSANSFMPIQPATADDNELSCDAFDVSDTYQPDKGASEDERYEYEDTAKPILSFPPALRQSSPPVPRHVHFARSSAKRSHKPNFTSIEYSRYNFSLNCSALRASAPDRHPIRRGRTEEEIARLRGRSYNSPSKISRRSRPAPCAEPLPWPAPSSSPFSDLLYQNAMLPPVTLDVKLTAPSRPPHPVSPTTNLRLHRERVRQLVGSPMRDAQDECLSWSPALNLAESLFLDHDTECQMFIDAV